jgi:4-hydroxy-2-oxoglutarate aldolase
MRENLSRYERVRLAGYLVLGSTGESVLLEERERVEVLRAAREAIPATKTLIAGVTSESTPGAVRQAQVAADCGADLVLASTPHYFRSQMTHEALAAHFDRLADASPVPLLLYNVPKFTGFVLPARTVTELSRRPGIAGIKESSGERDYLGEIAAGREAGFRIACGSLGELTYALGHGADAAILAAAAAVPEPIVAIANRAAADPASAEQLLERLMGGGMPLTGDPTVPRIKAALDIRGLNGGEPRPPLQRAAPETREAIQRSLERLVELQLLPAVEL